MQYREDRAGNRLSVLGFGCMRFPQKGRSIDLEETEREIMEAYHAGVNYYDTAYIYSGSEAALGEILARNGIREKVNIATKLPQYLVSSRSALDRYFHEQLIRLRTDHIDYYLMHHLTDIAMWEKLKAVGTIPWLDEKRKNGEIRYVGFSYHGNSDGFLYCMPCPKGVDIPGTFRCYNAMFIESPAQGRFQYAQTVGLTKEPAFASQCIGCGKCESHCSQQIPIREKLKEADRALRPLPYKIGINIARKFMFRKVRSAGRREKGAAV